MIHLPLYLEKKLKELFPRAQDRNDFVSSLVKEEIEKMESAYANKQTDRDTQLMGGVLHLYTDGGSRGNPGQAAIGCVLEDPSTGTIVKQHSEHIGVQTNNIAEYQALVRGLELAKEFNPNTLVCYLDSELVVKQVTGAYKVKMHTIMPFVEQVHALQSLFGEVSFNHIPRKDNYRADALVNKALDSLAIS